MHVVNGVTINVFADLHTALNAPVNGFHVLEVDSSLLEGPGALTNRIVIDAAKCGKATAKILLKNKIESDRSK